MYTCTHNTQNKFTLTREGKKSLLLYSMILYCVLRVQIFDRYIYILVYYNI